MTSRRLLISLILMCAALNAHAQMDSLPETPSGARALPFVHVELSWYGSLFWGQIGNSSVRSYIWGEAGEAIDGLLDQMGIDIQNEAGVLEYKILFEISGLGLTTPLSITGEIDKEIGETLEEAFERNYDVANLQNPTPRPSNHTGGTGGGRMDIGTLGNSNYSPYGYIGVHYQQGNRRRAVVTITDLN